jgi:putative spermidine/putrescine transport system ATP-binding protein
LLGPSGSGKSTILMMLAGFEAPTAGDILLDGRSVRTLPPHRRDIGVVFQHYALFPHMTVADNVAFPLEVRKRPRAEVAERVAGALALVRLDGVALRRPGQLSGGQQQRVALARALVFEPRLVLMDEPLGALDRQLREQMQFEIKHIHTRLGVTVVYVTHDQGEALTMSDRVAVVNHGVIQQLDSPEVVYERPGNAFVAHFIGENNRLGGIAEVMEGDACIVRLDDGTVVRATAVDITGAGARTTVSVRPERLHLAADADLCVNRFIAEVREVTYMGDHSRIRLAACGRDDVVAKVPHGRGLPTLVSGDRIDAGFMVEDGHALAADQQEE